MITCNICGKLYKRLDNGHLTKTHKITIEQYLIQFPGSTVILEETVKKYSTAQKTYAKSNPDEMRARSKKAKTKITSEQKQKTLEAQAKARIEKYDEIYGLNSLRNKKISQKTKDRWQTYSTEKKTQITKKSATTTRTKLGNDAYLEMMANKSIKGYKTLVKNGRGSKWEVEMIQQLYKMFPDTIADYRVGGRWYDAFIPSKNLLVEFDGDFWHPKTLDSCQYDFQKQNFHNDLKKNKIAIDHGYELIRIRQSESEKILEIK